MGQPWATGTERLAPEERAADRNVCDACECVRGELPRRRLARLGLGPVSGRGPSDGSSAACLGGSSGSFAGKLAFTAAFASAAALGAASASASVAAVVAVAAAAVLGARQERQRTYRRSRGSVGRVQRSCRTRGGRVTMGGTRWEAALRRRWRRVLRGCRRDRTVQWT